MCLSEEDLKPESAEEFACNFLEHRPADVDEQESVLEDLLSASTSSPIATSSCDRLPNFLLMALKSLNPLISREGEGVIGETLLLSGDKVTNIPFSEIGHFST